MNLKEKISKPKDQKQALEEFFDQDKVFELEAENYKFQLKVWDLEKMVCGLLDALNASEGMRKRKENEGLPRI